VTARRGVWL